MSRRQLVAVVERTGEAFGIVLDSSPMTDEQARRHAQTFGARCVDGASALAAGLAHRHRSNVTLVEVVYRPRRWSTAGRARRRYPEQAFMRLVGTVTIGSNVPSNAATAA